MAVIIGSARIDENGKAHGGRAGDQTGREVSTQNWYKHSKGWVVLRAKDPKKAAKIAQAMRAACDNQNIGYDQYQNQTLWNAVKDKGYDPAKAAVKCETDCARLVRVCCAYAGIMAKDFLSLDTDRGVMNSLQASGAIGVWQSNADKITEIIDFYGADYPELEITAIPRVAQDPTAQYVWNDEAALVATNAGFSLSSNCKNPELVCQWENFFWTTDGYYLGNYGTEGESYHMDGDTPVFDWDQPVTVTGRNAPNAEMAQQLFTMIRFASFYADNDMLLATFPQTGLDAVDLWTIDGSTDDRNYPSAVKNTFTTDESLEIANYESDLLTYAAEQCLKFLDGSVELNDDTWNEFVDTCNSMGLPEIIEVYQNAYDEYQAGER